MQVEIEAKLKVDSLDKVAARLCEIGGQFQAEYVQTDYYLDTCKMTLMKADSCLRIREEVAEGNKKVILAFKGPKQKAALKRRDEIEIGIDNAEQMAELLKVLGYEKKLVFEKRRKLWLLSKCEVALDELPLLGEFVEIEGPEEQIRQVQKNLDLAGLEHISESYACLMSERLKQLAMKQTEVYFES